MLSLLGCLHPVFSPWGFLDASPDANETRYHENRPQNVGGTGDSGLTTAQGAREVRAPLPDPTLDNLKKRRALRTIRSSGGPKSRLKQP